MKTNKQQNILLKKTLSPGETSAQVVNYLYNDKPFVSVRTPMNPQLAAKVIRVIDRWNKAERMMSSIEQLQDYIANNYSPDMKLRLLQIFRKQVINEFALEDEKGLNEGKPFAAVSARHIYLFVAHKLFRFQCQRKDLMCGRHHTTVLNSCRRFLVDWELQQINQREYINLLNYLHGDLLNSPLGLTGEEIFQDFCRI